MYKWCILTYGGRMSRYSEDDKKDDNKKFKYIVAGVLGITIIGGASFAYLNRDMLKNMFFGKKEQQAVTQEEKKLEKRIKIYDEDSKTRPIAVMLDNNKFAWPHSGINSAYMIYEMEIEGRRKQAYGII